MASTEGRAAGLNPRFPHGVVMQCLGMASWLALPAWMEPSQLYLKDYDHAAHSGRGFGEWTGKIEDAKVFPTMEAALEFWRLVPPAHPTRPRDGKPNRPLTVYSVEMVAAPPPGFVSTPFAAPGFAS